MPLELLRSSHTSGSPDEALSPTDCSEDSVEIRSPRPSSSAILRPSAVLAAPAASCSLQLKRSYKNWLDPSAEEPEEKKLRRTRPPSTQLLSSSPFYRHPHQDLIRAEADRNRLLHQWMNAARFDDSASPWMTRTGIWPLAPGVGSAAEAAHLMTSALHYYPHLISPSSYLFQPPPPPPPPSAAMMMTPHPFLHPQHPSVFMPYGLPLFHRAPLSSVEHPSPPPSLRLDAITTATIPAEVKGYPSSVGSPKSLPRTTTPLPLPAAAAVAADYSKPSKSPDVVIKKKDKSLLLTSADDGKSMPSTNRSSAKRSKKPTISSLLPASGLRKEKEANQPRPNSSGASFLSVETLLSRPKPIEISHPEEDHPETSWPLPKPAFRDPPHLPGQHSAEVVHHASASGGHPNSGGGGGTAAANRNYKNMTRERRMQANARERTRVHTISAAFEALRRAVLSFSHGQRLSKLSILRVASAYIAALGQLAGDDQDDGDGDGGGGGGGAADSLAECVDRCTRTLMTEGQMMRRKQRSGVSRTTGEANPSDEDDDDDWPHHLFSYSSYSSMFFVFNLGDLISFSLRC